MAVEDRPGILLERIVAVEGQKTNLTAALHGIGMILLIGQEVLQRSEQIRAKAAALRAGVCKPGTLDQIKEGSLGEVPRVRGVAAVANEGVDRKPVTAAELGKGRVA